MESIKNFNLPRSRTTSFVLATLIGLVSTQNQAAFAADSSSGRQAQPRGSQQAKSGQSRFAGRANLLAQNNARADEKPMLTDDDRPSPESSLMPGPADELPVTDGDVSKSKPSNPPKLNFPVKETDSEAVREQNTDELLRERIKTNPPPAPLQGSASNTEVTAEAVPIQSSPLSRYRGDTLVFFKVRIKNDGDVPVLVLGNNVQAIKPSDTELIGTKLPVVNTTAPKPADALPLRGAIVDPIKPRKETGNQTANKTQSTFPKMSYKSRKEKDKPTKGEGINDDLTAVNETTLEKHDNTLLSPPAKVAVGAVGVGTLGLAGPIFFELMTPSENGKRDLGIALGRDRGRHEVEGERLGIRLIMPGDDTIGWVAFGDGNNLRERKSLFVPIMFPPYSQISRALEVAIDWTKVAIETSGKDVK